MTVSEGDADRRHDAVVTMSQFVRQCLHDAEFIDTGEDNVLMVNLELPAYAELPNEEAPYYIVRIDWADERVEVLGVTQGREIDEEEFDHPLVAALKYWCGTCRVPFHLQYM
jgi:hypothetical protein